MACQAASGERRGGSADAAASVSGLYRRSSLDSRGSTPAARVRVRVRLGLG